MSSASSRTAFWITVFTVGGVFAYHLFSQLEAFLSACERGGDFSLLLLNVERATHFEALLGPYSRYKVAHPGPVVFYWYAVFEYFLHRLATPMGSAMVAQIVLNGIFAVAACVVLVRYSGRPYSGVLVFALALGMFFATKVPFLHYIWNPAVLLFPCVALLISAAVLFCHRSWAILLFVISALVMGHHHVAGSMFVVVMSIVTIFAVVRRGGLAELRSTPYLVSYVTAAIGMCPIIIEAFSGNRFGNVGRIWRHALRERESMPLAESLEFLSTLLSPVAFGGWINCGVVCIIFTLPWVAKLSSFEKALRVILLLSLGLGFFIVRGLHELTYDYLVWFLLAVAALQLWLVITILLRWLRIPDPVPAVVTGIVITISVLRVLPQPASLGGVCEPSGAETAAWASVHAPHGVRLELVGRDAWGAGAAIVNNFVRTKLPICVEKGWGFMFGRELTCNEVNNGSLDFSRTILVAPKGRREGEVIFDGGEYVVLEKDSSKS